MKQLLAVLTLSLISLSSYAEKTIPFKNADGSTKWQHVANFSASIFILTLFVVALFLFYANRRAARANRELTDIKATLEDRVARRTASLNETTENLRSREQYITSIVESMPLMLIGLNPKMEVIQWNNVAETATGRPLASVLGKNLWEVYPGITLTPAQVQQVLTSKQTLTMKHTQRDQYYFDMTLYALTDKGETGVVILVDDITKQMKAENKVAERDKMSAMGELASAMAYDINLPLKSIASTLVKAEHKIYQNDISAIKDELLGVITNAKLSSAQATAIIDNLLELASSHQDKKEISNIPQLMDSSIDLASHLFTDLSGLRFNQIEIMRQYQQALPQIACFHSEIQQVFIRLLRNAFHALNNNEQKNPKITIDINEFYDSVWIKLHHNGTPLSAAEQEDIFQPFFSLNTRPTACPVEHRLSYSYFIITGHHQGQMSVTSNEEFGTTFNIQLPLA